MEEVKKNSISLDNRRKLTLTGVVEVINFNDEAIMLNTSLGKLAIKGQGLKVDTLDVQNGDVIITGMISALIYSNKKLKNKKKNFLKGIFK